MQSLCLSLCLAACGGGGGASSFVGPPSIGVGQIDLSVGAVVSDSNPREAQLVTIALTVGNSALGSDATGLRLLSLLPVGLTYASDAPSQGSYDFATGEWVIGSLASGDLAQLSITAFVDVGSGGSVLFQSAAILASDQVDPIPGQDSATVSLTVDNRADLGLAMSLNEMAPVRNQPIAVTITLANAPGGARASGIEVTLSLSPMLEYDAHQARAGSFDVASSTWTLATLDSGSSVELVVQVSIVGALGGQALGVLASITAVDQPDPDPSDGLVSMQAVVQSETVELVRDLYGTPHVFASSDQGAYYGAGVATAEDRLSQILCTRMRYEGRMAEFLGPGVGGELVLSDRKARLYGYVRQAGRALAQLDPETRSLLRSFADGVNAVMSDPTTVLHPVFESAGIPTHPWTAVDCIALWDFFGAFFGPSALGEAKALHDFEDVLLGAGGDVSAAIGMFARPSVLDDSAAVVLESDVSDSLKLEMSNYASGVAMSSQALALEAGHKTPKFSQSWIFAGSRTVGGEALLVSDPRLPLERPSTLYELHVRGASFDVRGITIPGCMNLLVGQSANTAWGGSAIGIDQEDLFRLSVDQGANPLTYEWDGAQKIFEFEQAELIEVLGGLPVAETYRESLLGPVVTSLVVDAQPGEEYAVRRVSSPEFGLNSAYGFLRMYRAQDVDRFGDALEFFRYPSTNVVFGDSGGRIGYWANGAIPVRSPAQPYAALSGRIAQEGDRTDLDWIDIVPHRLQPSVIDPAAGVLLTANHMPIGSWYPIDIKAGTGSTGESSRSWRLRELLEQMVGLLDADTVLSPHFDMVNAPERDLIQLALHARTDLSVVFSATANAALTEAGQWLVITDDQGERGDKDSTHRAVALVSNLKLSLRTGQSLAMVEAYGSGVAGTILFLKTRLDEMATLGAADLKNFEITWIDDRLSDAWSTTIDEIGFQSNWAASYASESLTLKIPAWKMIGLMSLDPFDVLTIGPLTCTDPSTLLAQREQSFTTLAIPGSLDSGLSILPFGQAELGKAHATDQIQLFQDRTLKPVPMTRTAIDNLVGPTTQFDLIF